MLLFFIIQYVYAAKQCSNIVPGGEKMLFGWNMAKLNFKPIGSSDYSGFGSIPVIEPTCNNGQTWKSINGQVYSLPDQTTGIVRTSGGSFTQANIIRYSQITDAFLSISATIGVKYVFGMFGHSSTIQSYIHSIVNQDMTVGYVESIISSYELDLHPLFRTDLFNLTNDAQYLANILSAQCKVLNEACVVKYEQFFDLVGTHMTSSFKGGGSFMMSYSIYNAYMKTDTSTNIDANLKASFLNLIGAIVGIGGSGRLVDKKFINSSSLSFSCLGGAGGCPSNVTYGGWPSDVFMNPWPQSGNFISLSAIMPDNIKLTFDVASTNYFLKTYIQQYIIPFFSIFSNIIKNSYVPLCNQINPVILQCLARPSFTIDPGSCKYSGSANSTSDMYNKKIDKLSVDLSNILSNVTNLVKPIVDVITFGLLIPTINKYTELFYNITLGPTQRGGCVVGCTMTEQMWPHLPKNFPVTCTAGNIMYSTAILNYNF